MNSHRSTYKNSIWQHGDMRAGRQRLFDKAGVRPFSQRNQYNRTLQGPTYNDRHDITGLKQISQVEIAATQLAKIRCQAPSQRQLSP